MSERLRKARADDLEAVAAIWFAGWHDGHAGHSPEELTRVRTEASFRERTAARLGDTTLAEVDGAVAGFVVVRGDEVEQLYVAAEYRGTGLAGRLLRAAAAIVAESGHRRAWLAVASGNTRARHLYERAGWTDEGAFDYAAEGPHGSIPVPCHRYSTRVPD
jgi:ribosomal protein S18 acetylase RimI-like enzyme